MENKAEEVVAGETVSKWKKLVRQQSSRIGALADNIVLPKNERVLRQIPERITIEMHCVESQQPQTTAIPDQTLVPKKVEHFPYFMIGISLLQIFIFYSFDEDMLALKFGYDPYRRHELWRFLTTMFVHADWMHLWGNLVYQLILGVFLEIVHEWKRIGIIYISAAIGCNLCVTILQNDSYAVGASGAVMGLLASHLATIILNWNEMDRKFSRFFCLTLYIVYDVGSDVYIAQVMDIHTNVSHVGHFGGAVTGLFVSILVLKNLKKHPWELNLQKICFGILLAVFVIVFTMNVAMPDYFPKSEWNNNYEQTYEEHIEREYEKARDYDYEYSRG